MTEQQRQELQRIKIILTSITGLDDDDEEYLQDAYKALTRVLAEDALDKKAENARELGLSYDDEPAQPSCPECVFGVCHCEAAGGQKQPAQKPWVGLTVAEMEELTLLVGRMDYTRMLQLAESKLKEKNT